MLTDHTVFSSLLEIKEDYMNEATRNTYGHLDDQELVYLALESIVDEINVFIQDNKSKVNEECVI